MKEMRLINHARLRAHLSMRCTSFHFHSMCLDS